MKPFHLSRDMLNMSGQFYPTGHTVAMFPSAQAAEAAARDLAKAGISHDDMSLITPEAMLREISRTVGNADIPLPSAGTEADTVRRYADYAARGHYGLLIHAPGHGDDERLLQALRSHDVSHAQRYRRLIIEDIA